MGRYLRDYVHADDWRSLRDTLRKSEANLDVDSKAFFRMKTAMMPRGGHARKLTMAVYQVNPRFCNFSQFVVDTSDYV